MIRNTELAQLAKAVADWLPPGWRYNHIETSEWQDPEILGPNRMALTFRESWQHKGMVTIRGRDSQTSINCSKGRAAKAIAADIKRRLLDDYAKEYAERQQSKAERDARERELELIAQCFERLGLVRQSWRGNSYEITLHGDCTVAASEFGCKIEVRLPPDKALQLVGFLNSLKGPP